MDGAGVEELGSKYLGMDYRLKVSLEPKGKFNHYAPWPVWV